MDITTDRLIIRKFTYDDWQNVHEYTSDATVMKYMPEEVFTKEEAKEFIINNNNENAKNFPVVLKKDHTLIGHIVFHKYFGDHTYEIGWVFNPKYQNKGYASEAAYSVLKHGFEIMNLHRIIATCQPENIPSWRVMEKIGMRREGYFKKCIPQEKEWWDEFYYAILQDEWKF
ncbi:GNAT family N-acetyltransferase [Rummeliibacillus stabekisii]|uniref:GNAT family N-acetyltransferase n=1 Tax=Rummeliibacillus stabekisii TaxID=241244 RepID=UPI00371DFE96